MFGGGARRGERRSHRLRGGASSSLAHATNSAAIRVAHRLEYTTAALRDRGHEIHFIHFDTPATQIGRLLKAGPGDEHELAAEDQPDVALPYLVKSQMYTIKSAYCEPIRPPVRGRKRLAKPGRRAPSPRSRRPLVAETGVIRRVVCLDRWTDALMETLRRLRGCVATLLSTS